MQSNETELIQYYSIRLVLSRDMLDNSVFVRITYLCWLVIQSRNEYFFTVCRVRHKVSRIDRTGTYGTHFVLPPLVYPLLPIHSSTEII